MKTQRFSVIITLLNLGLLLLLSAKPSHQVFDKITVREFELVGKDGVKRASLQAYDDGDVVLRMMDKTGTIRVKLGADKNGSSLVLLDSNTDPGVHILAKNTGSSCVITGKDGKKRDL